MEWIIIPSRGPSLSDPKPSMRAALGNVTPVVSRTAMTESRGAQARAAAWATGVFMSSHVTRWFSMKRYAPFTPAQSSKVRGIESVGRAAKAAVIASTRRANRRSGNRAVRNRSLAHALAPGRAKAGESAKGGRSLVAGAAGQAWARRDGESYIYLPLVLYYLMVIAPKHEKLWVRLSCLRGGVGERVSPAARLQA